MHYSVGRRCHQRVVFANGVAQISCKQRKMAVRIVRYVTLEQMKWEVRDMKQEVYETPPVTPVEAEVNAKSHRPSTA